MSTTSVRGLSVALVERNHLDTTAFRTAYADRIFGVGDRLGSLEPGKIANVVVTDGDILEARTSTRYLIIDGRDVPLGTRHTDLYDIFKVRK